MEVTARTLTEAASAIRDGDVTAEADAAALLDRCVALAHLNAFIAQDGDAVLAAARAADTKRHTRSTFWIRSSRPRGAKTVSAAVPAMSSRWRSAPVQTAVSAARRLRSSTASSFR
jgi:hypothetical protein